MNIKILDGDGHCYMFREEPKEVCFKHTDRGYMYPIVTSQTHSVLDVFNRWVDINKTQTERNAYMCDIKVVNKNVKPVFKRSSKLRNKRRIITERIYNTKRSPRTVIYKDCHPINDDMVDGKSFHAFTFSEVKFS